MADKKKLTPLERRQKDIDDRAARVAALAKKKGMTVPELRKQERDTFLKVVGGAASLVPIGAVVRGATALIKGGKAVSKVVKGAKTTKTAKTVKPTKTTKTTKTVKPTTAASQSNRASSQGGRTAAQAKTATKTATKPATKPTTKPTPTKKPTPITTKAKKALAATTGIGAKKGRRSGMAIRSKDGRLSGVSKKTQELGKRASTALKGAAATSLLLGTVDGLKNSGGATANSSGSKPSVSSPTPRPTNKPSLTYRGGQRKAAPKKGSYDTEKKQIKKGPGVGKQDKLDPRKDFKSTPVKNAALPAGAKPFQGSYNNKTHKLQNIRGKTYVVKK